MVCFLHRIRSENRLKGLVEKLAADAENEDVKAAAQEYLDTYYMRSDKRNSYR